MPALPQLTPEQRQAATEKANRVRAAWADYKRKVKSGELTPDEEAIAAAGEDAILARLKVKAFVQSVPGVGKIKANTIMEELGIADNRRMGGLGAQQRKALAERLCA